MAEQNNALVPRWNRSEVNRYLLPVLRYVGGMRDGTLTEREMAHANAALSRCPEAYAQLLRVYHNAPDDIRSKWFGWIECDEAVLDEAFSLIGRFSGGKSTQAEASYSKQMYFAGLFRISKNGQSLDLAQPFEQYYFCDEVIYRDYLIRRLDLAKTCKEWIRQYLPYYNRIRSWYRENGEKSCGVGYEYEAYMELYDHFRDEIAYEDQLRDERQALEYERGGLGWFHRARKKEIDEALYELSLRELRYQIDRATERYEAFEAQFLRQREAWQEELTNAPVTAFARRRELKKNMAELELRLDEYREELQIEALETKYRKMEKSRRT
ncbi:MAG: hypothetical protein J6R04_02660 [Clostridia bacterium]|nr:hypothetical protein [Clostridia bacterium]